MMIIEIGSVIIEPEAKGYIERLRPRKVIKYLEPESFDCQNLLKIAKNEGKDTSEMSLTVHADYVLLRLEVSERIVGVFVTDPLCWTNAPSDWWWKSQRDDEGFKGLLRKATNTVFPVRVELPELKLLEIPRWFSKDCRWKLVKK